MEKGKEDGTMTREHRKSSVGERKPSCPPIWPRADQALCYSMRDLEKVKEFLGQTQKWVSEGFCVITFAGDG